MKSRKWVRIISYVIIGLVALPIILLLYLVLSPGYQVLTVKSGSMEPTFKAGDVIVLKTYKGGDIEPGQIIAFEKNGATVTHRAIFVENEVITTKGDALENLDSWEVKYCDIQGTYEFKLPYLGYIAKFFRSKSGALVMITFASLFLIGIFLVELLASKKAAEGGDAGKEQDVEDERERERERNKYWA